MRKKLVAKKNANYNRGQSAERISWRDDTWKDLLPEDLIYLNRQERRYVVAKKRKEDRKNK